MPRIDIKTILGFMPPCPKHELLVITRGATASIDYNLFDKVYDIENIDQMTFIFKQDKKILSFNLIDYFKITKDTVVEPDKNYYKRVEADLQSSTDFAFEPIVTIEGSSIAAYTKEFGDIYEQCELASGEVNLNWQFNKHFSHVSGNGYSYITFMLTSDETLMFKPTCPENNVLFEVVTRLNTDSFSGMHGEDSTIISAQHPIAVVDSLYGKIAGKTGTASEDVDKALVSEKTYCSEKLYCNN